MATEKGTFSYKPTTSGIYTWSFRMKNSGTVAQLASVYYLDNLVASYSIPYTRIDCDKGQNASYRFGFNGVEKESDMYGESNAYEFKYRMYDARIGKFLSQDPLFKDYPWNSPYAFAENDVIRSIDLEGAERLIVTDVNAKKRTAKLEIKKDIEVLNDANLPKEYKAENLPKQVHNQFEQGNTTLYVKELFKNGVVAEFITKEDYDKGVGYKVDVTYNVNVNLAKKSSTEISNGLRTDVYIGDSPEFKDDLVGGMGGVEYDHNTDVLLNKNFNFDESLELTAKGIIAHEVGDHNMKGEKHKLDNKKATQFILHQIQ